jgi:hypothetical protein
VVKALRKLPPKPDVEVAYDIETDGFSDRILCVCAVGSDGKRVSAFNMRDFVSKLDRAGWLRRKPGEVRFWAHYGGSFDVLVTLRWFLSNGWRIESGKAGDTGSLWSIDLVNGPLRLTLRDSARLFADSLRVLGKAFGLEKLDVDRARIAALSREETVTYCLRDCEIVLLAVQRFATFVEREGGSLADTIASCASRIVRARCVPSDSFKWNPEQDQSASGAYYGGRVERFRRESAGGSVFDVNSMYPWAMTQSLPTRFVACGEGRYFPKWIPHIIVEAEVDIPTDTYLGPLPYRPQTGELRGRLCFPTGKFRGKFTLHELRTAEELTPGFNSKIVRWWGWDGLPWLRELVETWYERRKAASNSTEKYMLKLLLNSVSGKLIERAEYESLTGMSSVAREAERDEKKVVIYPTEFGIWYGIRETKVGALRHAAAAAWVLSLARAKLLRAMHSFSKVGRLDYCDTDSVMGVGLPDEVDSSKLGSWKHELQYSGGTFLAPKLYALQPAQGELIVKCKGWPKTEKNLQGDEVKLSPSELWSRIVDCIPVSSERTTLIKSQIRTGRIGFSRYAIERKRNIDSVDKRCFVSNDSRPWTTSEIQTLKAPSSRAK